MMDLPYHTRSGERRRGQELSFGGVNVRANAAPGELAESENLSSAELPVLTQRGGRTSLGAYPAATALAAWERLLVVSGTDLYYDGARVGTVSPGEKQFAFLNTKLCIFPDKLYIDTADGKVKRLDGRYFVGAGAGTFTEDTLTVTAVRKVEESGADWQYRAGSPLYAMTYTALEWTDGAWVKTGGSVKELGALAEGDLLIPRQGSLGSWEVITGESGGDLTGDENGAGVYFQVTACTSAREKQYRWERFSAEGTTYAYYSQGAPVSLGSMAGTTTGAPGYTFDSATGRFYAAAGERTVGYDAATGRTYSGTAYSAQGSTLTIAAAEGEGFTLSQRTASGPYSGTSYTRGAESFGYVYGGEGAWPEDGRAADGYWYQLLGETGYDRAAGVRFDVIDAAGAGGPLSGSFREGDMVTLSGTAANDRDRIRVAEVGKNTIRFEGAEFTAGTEAGAFTLLRPIPDLDYVCVKDNRLFGASNSQSASLYDSESESYREVNARVIYASALGDPTNFYQYRGLSTDSYAVAVGSEGDFTGCTGEYGDCVLFWKERRLHILYGSYPAQFSLSTFTVNGLQAGSHKSQRVINNVLYYKGVDGVYAFSGSTPSLVSYKLGETLYRHACAGCDGFRYYISMQNAATEEWGLWVYDTLRGVWLREDDTHAVDMTFYNGHVAWLTQEGQLWQAETGADPDLRWSAQFTPLYEDTLEHKEYTCLYLRLELGAGARVRVEIARDEDDWELVYETGCARRTVTVPIRPLRCDRLRIRLSGTGPCVVRQLARELNSGSLRG